MRPTAAVLAAIVAATLALSVTVVSRLYESDWPGSRWRDVAQARLLFGVPWGSLVVIAVVLAVYLFVQDGITNPSEPVTIPYRAWSYFSPLGIVTASFSHVDLGHLTGNLTGAAVIAPIAEYAWGHYPASRSDSDARADAKTNTTTTTAAGRSSGRLETLRTTPWIRAVVLFPLAVIAIGLVTSLFALGPVIGFSGVVFAFAGFAIVHYPIATLVAAIGLQSVLLTIYRALLAPIDVYTATPTPPSAPSWAGIAIQGHALGFFIGLVLGMLVLERRGERPNPLHLWLALLLYAFSKGLWQIYWFGEGNTYVLLRGPGVVIVTALALVITLALTASDRPLVPRWLDRRLARREGTGDATVAEYTAGYRSRIERTLELADATGASGDRSDGSTGRSATRPSLTARLERVHEIATGRRSRTDRSRGRSGLTRRGTAFVSVLLVLAVLAGMAIPVNLIVMSADAGGDAATEGAIEIEGYTIEYDEDATNELVSGIGIDRAIDDSGLAGSGVIVSNDRHNLWMEAVSKDHLEATGSETITVGEPGWRETAHVERTGWVPVGNESVYQIWLWTDGADDDRQLAHESNATRADVIVEDRTITVGTEDGEFTLEVESVETGDTDTTPVPAENATAGAGGIAFERAGGTIFAVTDGTKVAVATEEEYEY